MILFVLALLVISLVSIWYPTKQASVKARVKNPKGW
jgi:hypothetical protein